MPTVESHEISIHHLTGISIAALVIGCLAFLMVMIIMIVAAVKNNPSGSGGSGSGSGSGSNSRFGPSMKKSFGPGGGPGKSTFMRY